MPSSPPKWTPGPWTAERANVGDKHPLFVVCNADIAFRPPCDADAHLIAAAPDLYAALSFADILIDTVAQKANNMGPVLAEAFRQAHAKAQGALAKARGGTA
jgi:hypothetical protein